MMMNDCKGRTEQYIEARFLPCACQLMVNLISAINNDDDDDDDDGDEEEDDDDHEC